MKKAWSFLQVVAGLLILGALAVGLAVAFRALSGSGAASALPGTPQGYPPPQATLPAPEATTIQMTRIAQATAMEAIEATRMAALTASAPPPIPTPGPLIGPQTINDPLNHFSLQLLPGWYASTPDSNAVVGVTTISNYDMYRIDNRPPGGMSIHISIGQLDTDQSFDQWLSERRALETSPEYGASGVTLTEPQPYVVGRYEGVTYTAYDPSGEGTMVIYLLTNDRRIVGIDLRPVGAPALPEALSMLSALEISPTTPP